jgi:hypothetical protein
MKRIEAENIINKDDFIYEKLSPELLKNRNFIIVIHGLSKFLENGEKGRDGNFYLFEIDDLFKEKNKEYLPVIHISLFDFFDDEDIKDAVPNIPLYKNIIDSSIWNYYLPYYKEKTDEERKRYDKQTDDDFFKDRLNNTVKQINKNYNNHLYSLLKTREYANLMYRLLKESYLEDGGHANWVSPFLFTSESKMEKAADKILEKFNKKISWRFLLVDDESYLSDEETSPKKKSKCQILRNIFCGNFNFECKCKEKENINCPLKSKYKKEAYTDPNKPNIQMVCVRNNNDALRKLQSAEKYDIVLMDYLLGYNSEKSTREYSTEILQNIKEVFDDKIDNEEDKQKLDRKLWLDGCELASSKNNEKLLKQIRGIYGKFWFFYISAYNVTIHEELLEKQFSHTTEYWYIKEGACPINTPQLFRYLLFSFMKHQVEIITELQDGVITQPQKEVKDEKNRVKDEKDRVKDEKNRIITVVDLLDHIFKNSKEARNKAINHFNNLLKLRLTNDKIKYDTCWKYEKYEPNNEKDKDENERWNKRVKRKNDLEKSALISSIFPYVEFYDNAFWEHTTHLVYLTAFGTIRQWHDMWEEFMLIKPYLQKIQNFDSNSKAEKIIEAIENYIASLQKESR